MAQCDMAADKLAGLELDGHTLTPTHSTSVPHRLCHLGYIFP